MSYTKEQLEKMRAEQAAYFERLRAQGEEARIAKWPCPSCPEQNECLRPDDSDDVCDSAVICAHFGHLAFKVVSKDRVRVYDMEAGGDPAVPTYDSDCEEAIRLDEQARAEESDHKAWKMHTQAHIARRRRAFMDYVGVHVRQAGGFVDESSAPGPITMRTREGRRYHYYPKADKLHRLARGKGPGDWFKSGFRHTIDNGL